MDTKNSSSNIVKGSSGSTGTDVKTVDMSGTNVPDATNAKTPDQRAQDVRLVDGAVNSTPTPNKEVSVDTTSKLGTTNDAPKLPTVRVRLLGNNTHEGIDYETGDIIEVDEQSAKYLESANNAVRV